MSIKTEKELFLKWGSENPFVSICCITYNHEKYISDALESFLMQETDFPFEILIHDDASTDNTADIIKKYEEKYPEIIKTIYQTENQKSKLSSGMNPTFNYPRAKGKYLALCEGDDYWTDSNKLQEQINLLERKKGGLVYTNYKICVNNKLHRSKINSKGLYNNDIQTLDKYIFKNNPIKTCTVVASRKLFMDCLFELRDAPEDLTVGDLQYYIYSVLNAKTYFLDKETSLYRINEGSASNGRKLSKRFKFALDCYRIRNYFINKYNLNFKNKLYNSLNLLKSLLLSI